MHNARTISSTHMTSNETEMMFNTKSFPQGVAVEGKLSKDKKYKSYLTLGRGREEVQPIRLQRQQRKQTTEMIKRIKGLQIAEHVTLI